MLDFIPTFQAIFLTIGLANPYQWEHGRNHYGLGVAIGAKCYCFERNQNREAIYTHTGNRVDIILDWEVVKPKKKNLKPLHKRGTTEWVPNMEFDWEAQIKKSPEKSPKR